ncbi:MAG TPA: alpha/beta fold hydrolase, partial [Gemmatimonadaceae bacterium]|nr:alpha/beta fold hydrolase [Gemmatimonadaceae bacterium]
MPLATIALVAAAAGAALAPTRALTATAGSRATPASHHHAPPRFDDVRLPTGVRLRYAEQGDPSGHPIILLHGYSDSWFSYSGVLPLLPERYHVYALDLRGHGESDRPAAGYAMRDLAADVVAFMDAK